MGLPTDIATDITTAGEPEALPDRYLDRDFTALAFDFGTHRIGTAYGQSLTGTARPLAVIRARDGIPDWEELGALIEEWRPEIFVVGRPFNMDESASELTLRARKFARRLHGRFHRPYFEIDERLTTIEARARQHELQAAAQLDCLAAQLILEAWFNQLQEQRRRRD